MSLTIYMSLSTAATPHFIYKQLAPLLLKHPRFKSYINPKTKQFETIPQFHYEDDFEKILSKYVQFQPCIPDNLSADERHDEFMTRLNDIVSSYIPINDPSSPDLLWRLYIIPQFSDKFLDTNCSDYSTFIFHVHHCISDGIGLLKFLVSDVIDKNRGGGDTKSNIQKSSQKEQQQQEQLLVPTKHLDKQKSKKDKVDLDTNTLDNFIPAPPNPNSPLTYIPDFFSSIYRSCFATAIPERRSALNRSVIQPLKHCYTTKSSDTTPCLKISYLKQVSKKLGVSINDLIYTAFSNAMTKYLLEADDGNKMLLKRKLRCSISVNQTAIEREYDLKDVGNYLALVPVPLENNVDDVDNYEKKLVDCIRTMRFLKRSSYVPLCLQMIKVFTLLPSTWIRPVWAYFTQGATTFFSNVPGPRSQLSICNGTDVHSIMFVPIVGGYMGTSISIMSYNDSLRIGISADRLTVKNPKVIVELIRDELNALCSFLLLKDTKELKQ